MYLGVAANKLGLTNIPADSRPVDFRKERREFMKGKGDKGKPSNLTFQSNYSF
jgi:hypothetical protein